MLDLGRAAPADIDLGGVGQIPAQSLRAESGSAPLGGHLPLTWGSRLGAPRPGSRGSAVPNGPPPAAPGTIALG
jgi:hypothetical protein